MPDPRHGRVLVLRDTQGVTDAQAVLPPVLAPLLMRFNGRLTCDEIARFSHRDAERYPAYEASVERVARFIEPAGRMRTPPPVSGRDK